MGIEKTLKMMIANSGKNLSEIAKEATVDYGTLHRFVNEGRKVQITFLEKLSDYFGLQLSFSDRQLKKVITTIVQETLSRTGRQFKHSNGQIKAEQLEECLMREDLPSYSVSQGDQLAIDQFNRLAMEKRRNLLSEVIGEIRFVKSMEKINQKTLRQIDQDLQEFRDSYEHLNERECSQLINDLNSIVEIGDRMRRLGSPHHYGVQIQVSHCYQDQEGEVQDENSVTLRPRIMLKALESWQAGEEFTPTSILGML